MKITNILLDTETPVTGTTPAGSIPVAVGYEGSDLYVYMLTDEATDFPDIQLQFTVYATDETVTGAYAGTANGNHVFYIETTIEA